jgi:hypothetical protein
VHSQLRMKGPVFVAVSKDDALTQGGARAGGALLGPEYSSTTFHDGDHDKSPRNVVLPLRCASAHAVFLLQSCAHNSRHWCHALSDPPHPVPDCMLKGAGSCRANAST